MALEGIVLNAGSGGQTLATDTVGGFDFQIVKIGVGADDSTPTSVSDSNPLPVDDAGGSLTVDNAGTFAVQVDGSALTALQLIDNIVQTEDAVHGSGDSGVMALAVRNDVLAALAGLDGDYAPLQVNASGALFIQEGAALDVSAATLTVNAHAVTNAGTFAVQEDGAALTALQLIDNIVSVEDAVHGSGDSGVMALAVRNDTLAALAGTDGDYAPLQVNASGALFIQEGAALDVSAATLTVNAHAVTNAGTFAVQEDGAALTALQLIDDPVFADDAAFMLASSKVMVGGGIRNDTLSTLTAIEGDAVPLRVDSTGALHVTGGGGGTQFNEDTAHTTSDAGTMALAVRNDVLAALAGTDGDYAPLQVNASGALYVQEGAAMDVSAATVTVTDNGSFTLAANSGVDIGDVDVLSVIPGTGATSLGKAEDAVHASGDTGVMALAVRNDTLAALAGLDGDYAPLQVNASGALFIQEGAALDVSAATVTVAGTGTLAVQVDGAALTALQLIDNIVQVEDAVHGTGDSGVMSLAVRNDTLAALATTDGDYAPLQVNASGALFVQEGAAMDVSAATVTVDNAGTFAVQVDGTALTALQLIDDSIFADDAAFTLASSKVTMSGAIRDDSLSTLTAIEGDAVPLRVSATGALHVTGGGGGTEYTEDVATANPIVGTATLMERDDALSAVTPIEGDWIGLRGTAEGALWTQDFNSDAILTAVELIDDAVFTDDAAFTLASSKVTMSGGIRDDSLTTLTAVEGDAVPLRVSATGALHVTGGGGGTEHTDDTSTHATGSTLGTLFMAAATPTDGSVDANDIGAVGMSLDRRLHVDAQIVGTDAALDVSAATLTVNAHAVTNAGTFAVQEDGAALTALQLIDNIVQVEDAVHGTGDSGVMSLAVRNDTLAALAGLDGDYAPLQVNASGALFIQEGAALDVSAATLTVNAHAVTNAGTFVVQEDGAALTALQLIDNIVQTEDAVHGTGDSGVMSLAVRNDVLAALAGTDGDYAPLQVNASGALFIQEGAAMDVSAATVTVDNSGTFATQVDGAALTALQLIDDAIVADDAAFTPATTKVMMAGFEFDDTTPDSVDEGDGGAARMSSRREVYTQIRDAAGNERGANVDASGNLNCVLASAPGVNIGEVNVITALPAGTNTIGKLAANSGVDIGDVDVTSQPARASTTDSIKSVLATDAVMDGTTSETPTFVAFDVSTSGDNQIIAGVASTKMRVLSLSMNAFGDVEAEFQSGSTTTNLSGTYDLGTSSGKAKGVVLPFSPLGHFESASGTALDLNLSGAIQVSGVLTYIAVAA